MLSLQGTSHLVLVTYFKIDTSLVVKISLAIDVLYSHFVITSIKCCTWFPSLTLTQNFSRL